MELVYVVWNFRVDLQRGLIYFDDFVKIFIFFQIGRIVENFDVVIEILNNVELLK